MPMSLTILIILVFGVAIFSLGYTLAVAREQKNIKGNLDSPIESKVQKNIYLRNPIFLVYIIFFSLCILTIVFFALSTQG